MYEDIETFVVSLSNPVNAWLPGNQAEGWIYGYDPMPQPTVSSVSITEGDAGTATDAIFYVTLSEAAGATVEVGYFTSNGSAQGGVDYLPGEGTLTFLVGETQKEVRVTVSGDATTEMDEMFSLQVGLWPYWSWGTGTIVNDDPLRLSIPQSDFTVNEGELLSFQATLVDSEIPQDSLVFWLDFGTGEVPQGASINSVTGDFSWIPTEDQGGNIYTFAVVVEEYSGGLSDRETVTVTVNEVDNAPVLNPIDDEWFLFEGYALEFTATAYDSDGSVGPLAFSLENAPTGASIETATGVFTWTPSSDQAGVYSFEVVVTDTGAPALSDSEALTVTVYDNDSSGLMLAARGAVTGSGSPVPDSAQLDRIVEFAAKQWLEALQGDTSVLTVLNGISVGFADLPGAQLGSVGPHVILLDADAAGYGWFIDATPSQNEEFRREHDQDDLLAKRGSDAYRKMDLLSVVTHELGHVLGWAHTGDGIMAPTLDAGERVLTDSSTAASEPTWTAAPTNGNGHHDREYSSLGLVDWSRSGDLDALVGGDPGSSVPAADFFARPVEFTLLPTNGNGNGKHNGNGNGHSAQGTPTHSQVAWDPLNGKHQAGLEVVEFSIAIEAETV
jgi:hypothetical protein